METQEIVKTEAETVPAVAEPAINVDVAKPNINTAFKAFDAIGQAFNIAAPKIEAENEAHNQRVSKLKAPVWAAAQSAGAILHSLHADGLTETDFNKLYKDRLVEGFVRAHPDYEGTKGAPEAAANALIKQIEKRLRPSMTNMCTVLLGLANGMDAKVEDKTVIGNVQKFAKEVRPLLADAGLRPKKAAGAPVKSQASVTPEELGKRVAESGGDATAFQKGANERNDEPLRLISAEMFSRPETGATPEVGAEIFDMLTMIAQETNAKRFERAIKSLHLQLQIITDEPLN